MDIGQGVRIIQVFEDQHRLGTSCLIEDLICDLSHFELGRHPCDMLYGQHGRFVPGDDAKQISIARTKDMFGRYMQQERHRLDQSGTIFP